MIDASRSIKACAAYYGDNADAMESYLIEVLLNLMKMAIFPLKYLKLTLIMVFISLKML